jgi:hypothetical protein
MLTIYFHLSTWGKFTLTQARGEVGSDWCKRLGLGYIYHTLRTTLSFQSQKAATIPDPTCPYAKCIATCQHPTFSITSSTVCAIKSNSTRTVITDLFVVHEKAGVALWYIEFDLPGAGAQRVSRLLFTAPQGSISVKQGVKAVQMKLAERMSPQVQRRHKLTSCFLTETTSGDGTEITYSFSYTTPEMGLNEGRTFSIAHAHATMGVKAESEEEGDYSFEEEV